MPSNNKPQKLPGARGEQLARAKRCPTCGAHRKHWALYFEPLAGSERKAMRDAVVRAVGGRPVEIIKLSPQEREARRNKALQAGAGPWTAGKRRMKHREQAAALQRDYLRRLRAARQAHPTKSDAALSPKIIDEMASEAWPALYSSNRPRALRRMRGEVRPLELRRA